MANIFTDFIRVYPHPGQGISETAAQWIAWMLIGPQGSRHVPVHIRRGPQGGYADVQYGSSGSPSIVDFCRDYIGTGPYAAIWARHFNEGGTQDVIWQDDVNDGPRRFCRYGLDEVRVVAADEGRLPACVADADGGPPRTPGEPWRRDPDGSWRRRVAGSYRAGNDRSAEVGADATPATVPPEPEPADRALATPTTPNLFGDEPTRVDPPWLASLTEGRSGAALVDWYHR